MLHRGERVLVGVSGGPDSMALLTLLAAMAPALDLDLHVAHLDHGWRGRASAADAGFVRRAALHLGLPVTVGRLSAGAWRRPRGSRQSSREARARDLRRRFLEETARQVGATRIALGHTLDDQAETFLLRLLRGSGGRGLGGIHPVIDGRFVRPLLDTRRRDLAAWLKERGVRWRVDRSNADLSLARNRVRRRLIPALERWYNPRATEILARTADLLRADEEVLDGIAEAAWRKLAVATPEGARLPASALGALPPALQRRVVRRALAEVRGDLRRITARHVEQALGVAQREDRAAATLPGDVAVRRRGGDLVIARRGRGAEAAPIEAALCPVPGEVSLPGLGVRLRARVVAREAAPARLGRAPRDRVYLDADLLPGPLLVRGRRPGDRFVPLGAPGTRRLKSFLIDRKVPVDERGRIPLVLSGERIAWVVTHAIDDRFKVTDRTRRVLVLEKESR